MLFIVLLMVGSIGLRLPPSLAGQSTSFDLNWLVVARNALVALVLLRYWRSYSELRDSSATPPAHWLLAALAGFAVFLLWIYFDQDWAVLSHGTGFDPSLPAGGTNWVQALARLAGFALVVPVMEELFWRSFLLRWIERHDFLSLAPRRTGKRAFLITAALFGLEHDRWFAGTLAGLVYGGLYVRAGNLWVPIIAHTVTNTALGVWILLTRNWHYW